jgi:hypothetical protein
MKGKIMLLALVIFLVLNSANAQTEDIKDLYQQGKQKCIEQNWDDAIIIFEKITKKCPGDIKCDDAIFWLGYCIEIKGENLEQAFQYFENLNQDFAASPWTDDACIHQIGIAEKLIIQGKLKYLDFLFEKLNSKYEEIKRQAAIALGKFGDKRALAELNRIPSNDEQYQLVKSIIAWIETKNRQGQSFNANAFISDTVHVDVMSAETNDKGITKHEHSSLLESQSEKQYKAMLRDDDNWSQREVLTFALWHILPSQEFREFFSLSGYDQDEWLRKFWHRKDPTPTTEKNEYEEEINRRIQFARKNYSQLINFRHTIFQSIQYLSEGKKHAPWDARGELYIKYGAADVDELYAYQTEGWTYWKYDMDFFVKQYMTNIYGNAIMSGPLTRKKNIDPNNYYYVNEEPIYKHDYKAPLIKDIDLKVINQKDGQLIRFSISTNQLKAENKDNQYIIHYFQRIVIFDSDKRKIKTDEQDKVLFFNSKKDIKSQDKIAAEFKLELKPGEYEIALSIEDKFSNKLGVWSAEFIVK